MEQFEVVIICITAILSCVSLLLTIHSGYRLRKVAEDQHNRIRASRDAVAYSNDTLAFIRTLVTHTAIMKFDVFIDDHELDKTNRAHYVNLVKDVAETVHKAINENKLDYSRLIFNQRYLDSYIIESSSMVVKELLEKEVAEVVDQNENHPATNQTTNQ